MKYKRAVLILVLLTVAIPVSAEPWIAFSSKREGNRSSRFIVHPDGSNLINLSESLGVRPTESQSPDQTKIVFDSRRWGGNSDIYVMDIDGSNRVKLSHNTSSNYSPRWSPDGTQVMWYGWPPIKGEGQGSRVYLNDPDGANLRELGLGTWPHWSPDGTMIGFTREGFVKAAMIMNADGSGRREVTNLSGYNTQFISWSPDGSKVALNEVSIFNAKVTRLAVVNVDGSDLVELTMFLRLVDSRSPQWSRDGTKIIFAERFDIFVVNVDGTNLVNLTGQHYPGGRDLYPAWSPDETKIVFQTNRVGNEEVFIMSADGSNPVNLSNHRAEDWGGYWYNGIIPAATSVSPQGKLISTWGEIKHGKK